MPLELVKQIPKDGAKPLFELSIALYPIVHVVPPTLPAPEPRFDPQSAWWLKRPPKATKTSSNDKIDARNELSASKHA